MIPELAASRRWRAPAENGGVLVDPPLPQWSQILASNRDLLDDASVTLAGRPLTALRRMARAHLWTTAIQATEPYRKLPTLPSDASAPLILTGHQPQLFHPGVWYKNVLASRMAQQLGGWAVNMVIDSDTIRAATIHLPSLVEGDARFAAIPFDASGPEIPYEERDILDRDCFATFENRVAHELQSTVPRPVIREFWPHVMQRAAQGQNLGTCLAQGRHRWEATLGLQTLEIPQSQICQSPAFLWFAASLFLDLPQWHQAYNQAIHEFRQLHHLRSTAHPAPLLARQDDWLESPFWVWYEHEPIRHRLFIKRGERELVLTDFRQQWPLPLEPERTSLALAALAERGIKIRSRALITTLFARMVLGDAFIHGIGGARYDEVTDALIRQMFGVEPPRYMAGTATLRLPIEQSAVTHDDLLATDAKIRELNFHPERFLSRESAALTAASLKQRWIAEPQTRENAKERCQSIRQANQDLQPFVETIRADLLRKRAELERQLASGTVLGSREYAFCLFPLESLQSIGRSN